MKYNVSINKRTFTLPITPNILTYLEILFYKKSVGKDDKLDKFGQVKIVGVIYSSLKVM